MRSENSYPVCLTIAGLDPSGGAGILADIKTFAAFGCFGTAAISSVTFQNTLGVFGAVHQTADSVRHQVEPVLDDFEVAAVKTGMLPTRDIIEMVADIIRTRDLRNVVIDPVVRSTSGFDLIDDAALGALKELLFPLADLVTPNLAEAERIAGFVIESDGDLSRAGEAMLSLGARAVLIKGGHSRESGARTAAVDRLYRPNTDPEEFSGEFIRTTSTHGTGCTLAAAIAAGLAKGDDLSTAVLAAKSYVTEAIRNAPGIGRGNGPVNHFVKPGGTIGRA